MKKNQRENFNYQLERGFILVILVLLLSISSARPMYGESVVTKRPHKR